MKPSNKKPSILFLRRATALSATFALCSVVAALDLVFVFASQAAVPRDYKGIPFVDAVHPGGPTPIPGRIQCAYFDFGGEGVAFHSDGTNHGNHDLTLVEHFGPKASFYVWQFRANEAVSISFTSTNHGDHWFPKTPAPFDPATNQIYIGWTKDGQWLNYTVDVKKAGTYKVTVLYSNDPTTFSFLINHKPAGEFKLPLKTGSMHAWNLGEVGTITFPKAGVQLLTFQYNHGNNFACFDFDLIEKK